MVGYPVRQSMMNLSKNLYVFMLALLIVASGCLGSGTTGADEEVGSTVNNYYWNNTTEVITELPEMIALGGVVVGEVGGLPLHNYTATINTTAGQMVEVHEVAADGIGEEAAYMMILTNCSDGDVQFSQNGGGYLPGSAFDCTHTIDIIDGDSNAQTISWSLVYSIVPVTVG